MPVGSIIHPAPTNIINSVRGWNTRHIYNYYGTSDYTDFNYPSVTVQDYSQNLFQVIEDYAASISPSYPLFKGGYKFPARYFRAGKSLKIKTFLYIDTDVFTNAILNLNVGISNSKSTYVQIGASNAGEGHQFGGGNTRAAYVEAEIFCRGIEVLTKPITLSMMATGYIRYDVKRSTNDLNFLIPIIPTSTTLTIVDADIDTPADNELNINFDGSSDLKNINVLNLSIEELE